MSLCFSYSKRAGPWYPEFATYHPVCKEIKGPGPYRKTGYEQQKDILRMEVSTAGSKMRSSEFASKGSNITEELN